VVEKYRDFSSGLIFMGGLPNNFNLGHFKVAFHLMDPNRNFSCEICKTHCSISQSLDDTHASLTEAGNNKQLTWSATDQAFLPSAAFVRGFLFCIFVPLVLFSFLSYFLCFLSLPLW
jgi:hypothetical protein